MQKKDLRIISPEKECRYVVPGHPESPRRLEASYQYLKARMGPAVFTEPRPATEEDILAVHTRDLFEEVKAEKHLDADTPGVTGIFQAALLSAGAAIQAAETALNGPRVFTLIRPPGHHATPERGMGFCYFNSMAVACESVRRRGLAKKAAVVDIDVHHGNGTEAFFKGKAHFLYMSIHQSPHYPGTGIVSAGNCINFPLSAGSGAQEYRKALGEGLAAVRRFQPDLVGISIGFDTYLKDPLSRFGLKKVDFRDIGRDISEGVDAPQFAFLEGGYHEDLPLLIEQFLDGWTD